MNLINIDSFHMLKMQLDKTPNAYLLLYKSGSEASDCALKNASGNGSNVTALLVADVKNVKDIHSEYGVKTAPVLLSFHNKELQNTYKGCNDVGFYKKVFSQEYYAAGEDGETKPQKRVTVYSTASCSWCTTLKKHLEHNGIRYRDIDISKDADASAAMQKRSGQQGVPQTDINGQMIVGFDKNKINSLLGIQ